MSADAAASSPFLRCLASQPELILGHFVPHPITILRIAVTCRTAYRVCFAARAVWRAVCVAHHVYLPLGAACGVNFVRPDTELTSTLSEITSFVLFCVAMQSIFLRRPDPPPSVRVCQPFAQR